MACIFLYKKNWKELERLFHNLQTSTEELALTREDGLAMNVCLEEVFTNILKYGDLPNGNDYVIYLRIERDEDKLSCTVKDNGQPFNPLQNFSQSQPLKLEEISGNGIGLKLVSKLMDQVTYSYNNYWNQITLLKYLGNKN